MGKSQKAVLLQKYDESDILGSLSIGEVPMPETKDDEAFLRILLRPINPADVLSIRGVYGGFQPTSLPAVPGIEAVAEVVKSAGKFKTGQRVVARGWPIQKGNGTWQEYYSAPEKLLEPVPDTVSDEQAAIFYVNPITAIGLIRSMGAPKGEWVLQSAAASAVGKQVIQIAKNYGIKTINVVRKESQKQELLDLGADVVISTDKEEIGAVVKKVTGGKGAYGAADPVVGEMTGQLLSAVRPGGTIFVYGVLSGSTITASVADLLFALKHITGFWVGKWFDSLNPDERDNIVAETFRLLGENIITPSTAAIYPLDQAKQAIEEWQKPGTGGKKIFLKS